MGELTITSGIHFEYSGTITTFEQKMPTIFTIIEKFLN